MGTFRTLTATLRCLKCDALGPFDIQFKTGDDVAMSVYGIEDLADDIAPGVYDGVADSFCSHCHGRWVEDEKRAHFDLLGDEVDAGVVTVRRATWQHGALVGHPERGLVVTLDDEPPLTSLQVRALADVDEGAGWPNFWARLSAARVTLWVGSTRITPWQPESDAAHAAWWGPHQAAVTTRLQAKGWPSGENQFREVALEVMPNQRFRLVQSGGGSVPRGSS